jgi:hypothetical protein
MDPTDFTDLVRAVTADAPPVTVTLVLPVDGASPDRGPDGIAARRLARTAVAALTAGGDGLPEVDRDTMADLADRLDEVADEVGMRLDRRVRGEGLACVVTPRTARIVGLTHTPRERVVVETEPTLIDPLLDAVTADADVDVLVLSTGGGATAGTRLLRLTDHELTEPAGTGLPMEHDVRDHGEPRKEEPPDDRIRDAYVDDFLRRVDERLVALPEADRRIVGVDVGPDAAAQRMAASLLEAAVVAHERWRSWFPSEDDCREESGNTISAHGETEQVLLEEPCAFPDGPPLRCFLLVDLGYPAGAAHGYLRLDQLVFDAATGTRLTLAQIFAPASLDVAGARDLVDDIVAHLDGAGWEVELERARPIQEGLVISFAPYEAGPYADGTRQLFVPWDVLTTPEA